jgi:hypothetical protein
MKTGVRDQNSEVKIHTIIQSEAFWLLAPGFWILVHAWLCPAGHAGLYEKYGHYLGINLFTIHSLIQNPAT